MSWERFWIHPSTREVAVKWLTNQVAEDPAPGKLSERDFETGSLPSKFRWAWYLTQTFAKPLSSRRALESFKSLLAGFALPVTPCVVFWGLEYSARCRGERPHIHALIQSRRKRSAPSSKDQLKALLEAKSRRLGWSRWLPYDPKLGAARYVTKYILKDMMAQWGIWTRTGGDF